MAFLRIDNNRLTLIALDTIAAVTVSGKQLTIFTDNYVEAVVELDADVEVIEKAAEELMKIRDLYKEFAGKGLYPLKTIVLDEIVKAAEKKLEREKANTS